MWNTLTSKKKGAITLENGAALAVVFAVFIMVGSFVGNILAGVQANQTTNSTAFNITGFGLTGLVNLYNQSGNMGLVLGGVIIIGLLVGGFMIFRQGGQ